VAGLPFLIEISDLSNIKSWIFAPLFITAIGRKRTTEERRRYAEKSDFHDDNMDADDNPVV
jgi:DNA-directed RNA polymerase specialized sigma24 family protein